jgi:hypothetical protein
MSLSKLSEVAKFTSSILVTKAGKTFRGVGVVLESGGRTMLYTVKHVVDGAALLSFQGKNIASPDFRNVSSSCDPIVAMKFDDEKYEKDPPPSVQLMTREEIPYIQSLAFISPDDQGKSYTCVVPEFKICKDGTLQAIVNLKKGDSGSPCFSVLKDGSLRFCGVVSQGNPRNGGGNIISFCVHNGDLGADSSEDEVDAKLSVQQFNRVRRVKFASDRGRYDIDYKRMISFLEDKKELLESLRDWDDPIPFSDVRDCTPMDVAVEKYHTNNYVAPPDPVIVVERRGVDGGGDPPAAPEDEPGPGQGKKKRDAKARNKDKAYRKRALETMCALYSYLRLLYSERDSEAIFTVIAAGNLPPLDSREYVLTGDGRNWMVSNAPVDPDRNCGFLC